jgi:aryl-alcohol dehydrogenase-like predicted oxidoreductase
MLASRGEGTRTSVAYRVRAHRHSKIRPTRSASAFNHHPRGAKYSTIIGATKLAHLEDAILAVETLPSDDALKSLEAPVQAYPVKGAGAAGPASLRDPTLCESLRR